MPFRKGDRVRLGATRGGIVDAIDVDGREKQLVRFPHGFVSYIDHCVPDDGPDGRIHANEWEPCEGCGNPCPVIYCVNCRARQERESRWRPPAVFLPLSQDAAAPIGVHVVADDGRTCARCGAVLTIEGRGLHYKPGDFVERGRGWQALTFAALAPTCEAK